MLGIKTSKVVSVTRIAPQETFDFTVEPQHEFFANGMLVHNCMARFHPHGDQSIYGAMVGMAGTRRQGQDKGWFVRNTPVPLFEGQGNWGDFNEREAAMRYTEARLSKFSAEVMLDPEYLAVADYVPNYDGSRTLPLILPAKLPLILLNGYSAIGVGVSASGPAFSIESLLPFVEQVLQGKALDLKQLCTRLKFDPPYGGECLATPREMIPIIKHGKGSAYFAPTYFLDEVKRLLTFTSVCPGLSSAGTVNTFMENLSKVNGVAHVDDDSGPAGTRITVSFGRSTTAKALQIAIDKCLDISIKGDNFDLGVSTRQLGSQPQFKRSSVIQVLEEWAVWRIGLELKVVNRLLGIEQNSLLRQQTLLIAVDNLEVILQALRVKKDRDTILIGKVQTEVDASAAYLMRKLKLSLEQAELILDMKVRSLRSIEKGRVQEKIVEISKGIKTLQIDQKSPDKRAVRGLNALHVEFY